MREVMVDFTVAIPCYNGEKRLPQLLERLLNQVEIAGFTWEVLVVDNNSTDDTFKVIQEYQQNWPGTSSLNYCFEAEQGTAFARIRAVQEAHSPLIGFLDDDNLPAPNWVAQAYQFAQEHPQAGAYGSQIQGIYEENPPENFEKIAGFFGITERGEQPFMYDPLLKLLPPAAGLVVRKEAWLGGVPGRPCLTGPVGNQRLASEDIEAVLYIQKSGWEIWYNPAMKTEHQISASRLTPEYLINLAKNTGLVRYHIRRLRWEKWQEPLGLILGLGNDLRKLINYWLEHREVLTEDAVAQCEFTFLKWSLVSPFYFWVKALKL